MIRFILASLALAQLAAAATIPAASVAQADVAAAISSASNGDTVTIPAGTATWTSGIAFSKSLIIKGAGRGVTNINYGWTTGTRKFFQWTTQPTGDHKILDISFGYVNGTSDTYGYIELLGSSQSVHIERCDFTDLPGSNITCYGTVSGVIADCTFTLAANSRAVMFFNGNNTSYGDPAWNVAVDWGGPTAMYVEDCAMNRAIGQSIYGAHDGWMGARSVLRYNTYYNCNVASHGTESGNRYRSTRSMEIYNNTITLPNSAPTVFHFRGGTGVVYDNTVTGTATSVIALSNYRSFGNFQPWGTADGTLAWDVNDTTDGAGTPGGAGDGVFESGTANPTDTLSLADTSGITITTSGTTATASASVFTAAHVGKAIFWVPELNGATLYSTRTITGYISGTSVTIDSSTTRATPWKFIIGDPLKITDTTKSWMNDQWIGYTARQTVGFTATSGASRSATVTGAGWETDQWKNWEITKTSGNAKGTILSNTSDTLTLATNNAAITFAASDAFVLSRASLITDNDATSLTLANQGTFVANYTFLNGAVYEIRKVTKVLDGVGRGASNLPTGSPLNHQNLSQGDEPLYHWGNTYNGSPLTTASTTDSTVVLNRDYYDATDKPGYTPYTYPHPLRGVEASVRNPGRKAKGGRVLTR